MTLSQTLQKRNARKRRTNVRAKLSGRPRLLVFRSNKAITAHIIDDAAGKTICGVSGLKAKESGVKQAEYVGTEIAKAAKAKKVTEVSFDRNGYAYHGQVKALAEAARKGGLSF